MTRLLATTGIPKQESRMLQTVEEKEALPQYKPVLPLHQFSRQHIHFHDQHAESHYNAKLPRLKGDGSTALRHLKLMELTFWGPSLGAAVYHRTRSQPLIFCFWPTGSSDRVGDGLWMSV